MRAPIRKFTAAFVIVLSAAAMSGCATGADATPAAVAPAAVAPAAVSPAAPVPATTVHTGPSHAICNVMSTHGNTAHGAVHFEDVAGGVHVTAVLEGLSPGGTHAIHVHEFGDCSAPDGMSTGGHYNPDGHPHAGPDAAMHHAGDFGNLIADATGRATLDFVTDNLTVAGEHNPVIGRAIIVHAKADDMATQPTGNAGARIACGVIGVAKPPAPAK